MSALLMFSLGPVQPFIAQARKTRDLWIGSYLLSKLMREGLRDYPGELLFPVLPPAAAGAVTHANAIADLPNKFVARHGAVSEATNAAGRTKERIEETWRTLANQVWDQVFRQDRDSTLAEIWKRQTDPAILFEIHWVAVPYDDSPASSSYGEVYQRAQALLDARKRLRAFLRADESGEKSTISGEREALHRGAAGAPEILEAVTNDVTTSGPPQNRWLAGLFGRRGGQERPSHVPTDTVPRPQGSRRAMRDVSGAEVRAFWQELGQRFPDSQLGRSGRERLDAVDVIKRFATSAALVGSTRSFPSTDTVATAPFFYDVLQQLQQPSAPAPLRSAAEEWAQRVGSAYRAAPGALPALDRLATAPLSRRLLSCDAEALHAGSFSPRSLQDVGLDQATIADLVDRGPKAVSEFVRQAGEAGVAPPTSYYAVLLLDGDHMGRLLSSITSPDDHRGFSEALSRFAHTYPRDIVEGPGLGRVVYAGGDDVLAFLPAAQALRAAQELSTAYSQALTAVGQHMPGATASAGIAIAHARTPLRQVLAAAREAEHAAKEFYGRNALAVSLLRRSGAITLVGTHWGYPPISSPSSTSGPDPVRTILAVSDRLRIGDLSPRLVYAVVEEASALAALDTAARRAELARMLRRQRQPDRVEHFPDQALEELAEELTVLTFAFDQTLPSTLPAEMGYDLATTGPRRGMVELSGWLLVAAFLARGEDEL